MGVDFTEENTVRAIAEGLRREQGDGFKETVLYKIEDKLDIPKRSSEYWIDAKGIPGGHRLLKLFGLFGPRFANPLLKPTGYKLVPIDGGDVDAPATKSDIDKAVRILTGRSDEIGRAIEHGGGDAKEEEAA